MTTYYKAIRPDGTSFHDPAFRWVPKGWTPDKAMYDLRAATEGVAL